MASEIELSSIEDDNVEELDSIPRHEAANRFGGITSASEVSDGTVVPFLVRKPGRLYRAATGTKFLVKEESVEEDSLATPTLSLEPDDEEEFRILANAPDLDDSHVYADQVDMAEQLVPAASGDEDDFDQPDTRDYYAEELVGCNWSLAPVEEPAPAPSEPGKHQPIEKSAAQAQAASIGERPQAGQAPFDESLKQAEIKVNSFLRACEAYKRDSHQIREDLSLSLSVFEAKGALETVIAALFTESCKQMSALAADLSTLRRQQAEATRVLEGDLSASRSTTPLNFASVAKASSPLSDVETRRAALIKEIKQLVEDRGQLRDQLEALLAQLATQNAPKTAEPVQASDLEPFVEEICFPKRQAAGSG